MNGAAPYAASRPRNRPGRIFGVAALMVLFANPVGAQSWDWLMLYPTEIEAIARFDGIDRQDSEDLNETARDIRWEAGLRIGQNGYILDPDIARFLIDIEPVYSWNTVEDSSFREDLNGNLLNYLLQIDLLQGTPGPLGFNLMAQRSSNFNTGTLGSRTDDVIDQKSAAVHWKNQAFPMRFVYDQRSLQQEFLSSQNHALSERNELLKTWTAEGRSSKLDLLVEHQTMDDRISQRDLDFDQDQLTLGHRLPWGSDSLLRSRFDYINRNGFNASERLTLEEVAQIQHTDSISSRSSYRYFSVQQNLTTTEHNSEFEMTHQMESNLASSVRAILVSRKSDNLDETRWRTGAESNYHKQDLFGAAVNAGLGFSFENTIRDSKLGLVEVFDEPHLVRLRGSVILNQRFILNQTIIATDANGTLVYAVGFDYSIINLTEDLTQLLSIPGGRIETDDIILISYQAQVLPSQEFTTTISTLSFGIDLGWMRFSHYDRKSDDKLLSGAGESFLNDTRSTITNVEFRWKFADFDTVFDAERRFNLSGGFEATTITFRQLLTWAPPTGALWNLNAVQSFTEQETLDTDLYNIELSANWQPTPSLSVRPTLGAWKRYDQGLVIAGGGRDDTFLTGGLTLRWRFRKIAFDLGYRHNIQTTNSELGINDRETVENRLMLNLSRRF